MAYLRQLLLPAVFLVISTFVFALPPPGYEVSENLQECRRLAGDLLEPAFDCYKNEFSEEMMSETRRLVGTTTCVPCKHLCRRHDQISACVRQGVELGKDISNKSKIMIPFTGQLIDTTLHILCDNEDEMFPVVTNEEGLCFRNATDTCDHHLDFIHNMEVVAFCDSANPDTDPFTQEYMCRKIADFLDCSKELVASCSEKIVQTLSTFKTKLFNSDACAAYN
ncbi:uncharacterized protein LOC124154400 isoform X2 [Ischnura elegans]|uniref:uncharacterized protein LOC124154400 isoform X2 n=1 Tax=Ischnura elegans TaxID=197161 RepID=UPI001ED8933E|nr:uncharacterized protein LOC124154400 isoform X2 [Ischnura elegans]